MFAALGHDFVLRRNIRIALTERKSARKPSSFVASTLGSHHIRLINHNNQLFNCLLEKEPKDTLRILPVLRQVDSGEVFGLGPSAHTETYGGLLTIKEEAEENELINILDSSERFEENGERDRESPSPVNGLGQPATMPAALAGALYVIVSRATYISL